MSKSHLSARRAGNQYPILENLFNSRTRVKVLKFLFRNHPVNVGIRELSRRIQESVETTRQEIKQLEKIGVIRKT